MKTKLYCKFTCLITMILLSFQGYSQGLTAFTVSGSAHYCGSGSSTITLSGSQSGSNYEYTLYRNGVAVGEHQDGTGSALTWTVSESVTGSYAYTVKAHYVPNNTNLNMTGGAGITVNPTGGPVTTVSSVTVCRENTTVDIPVKVSSFTNVGIISLRLAYDHTKISSPTVIYTNPALWAGIPPDYLGFSVNTTGFQDQIRVSGFGPGITLDDNSILFTLRFDIVGSTTSASLTFIENTQGTYCEYSPDAAPDYIPYCDKPTGDYYIAGGLTVNTLTANTIGTAQTICEGTTASLTGSTVTGGMIAYQWQSSSTQTGTYANVSTGGTSKDYTTDALSADTWYRRIATSTLNEVPCFTVSDPILVTVNNFIPGSISGSQVICEGDDPAAFTSVAPTGDGTFTYQWQVSTNNSSFSNISGATSETYNPDVLTADAWYKRIVTSSLNGNDCSEETNVLYVEVINFVPGSISGSQVICEGDDPNAFTSAAPTGDGVFTYQWQSSTTSGSADFANIDGATSETYNQGILSADTWYRRLVTATSNGHSCTEVTNVLYIEVINFIPGSISGSQVICEGDDPNAFTSAAPTGDGVFTYQWQSSTTSGSADFANIDGATSETYNQGILSADTWYRRLVTATSNGHSCTEVTNVLYIEVINFVPGSISGSQVICEGDDPNAFTSAAPTGDGVFTYQWQSSTTSGSADFANIDGATSETYNQGILSADTWYRRLVTATSNGHSCTEVTNVLYIEVINFIPGSISGSQVICEGDDPNAFTSAAPTGDGVFTYQWQASTTSGSADFANIDGATSETYNQGILSADTWYRRLVTATSNGHSCTEVTNVLYIEVINFVPGSISGSQVICEGDDPNAFTSAAPTGDGVFTYQWQSSTTSGSADFANIDGATSETYNQGILSADTWYRRLVTATSNGHSCTEVTNVLYIEVINFIPGSISGSQVICEGDDPDAFTSVAPTGDGLFTYQWQASTTSGSADFANIDGATSETYNQGILSADTWYRRLVTATSNGHSCTEMTNVLYIEVINFIPGSISGSQVICEGDDPNAFTSAAPTGDGVFTYQWQASTTSGSADFANIDGATSETYNQGILSADTWYRRLVTATSNGHSCTEVTNVLYIEVINFVPGSISGSQVICEGDDPNAFTSAAPTGDGVFTYQWQSSTTSGSADFANIDGATSETYNQGILSADTWYRRLVTATSNGHSCTEVTNVLYIEVINFIPGSISGSQVICEGDDPNAFTSAAPTGDGVFTYQWQSSTTSGSADFANIDGATSETYNQGILSADTWYRRLVTATSNGHSCTEVTNVLYIEVINFIPGSISGSQVICEGDDPNAFTSVAPTGDGLFTYQWQSSPTSGSTDFANIDGATSETYNQGILSADTWYRRLVTATSNGHSCTEVTNVLYIEVINFVPGSIAEEQTICSGDDPVAFTSVPATGDGSFAYQWQKSTDNSNFSNISGATSETYDPDILTADTWYRRVATASSNGKSCIEESNVLKITVNQRKTISGVFNYYNTSNTVLTGQDIKVKLYKTSDTGHSDKLGEVMTDASGYYEFTNLCPDCSYDVVATSTHTAEGSVNTTDAAQVNYWFTHQVTIEKVRFYAGDVADGSNDFNNYINSTDALRIQRNFVYGDAFGRPDWTFWKAGETISANPSPSSIEVFPSVNLPVGTDITADMYGLCTGDFNRSYDPDLGKSAANSMNLIYNSTQQIGRNQEFDLPVRLVNASKVGAMSLVLNFPADLVTVSDVFMNGTTGQLDWTINGNELRIGWNSQNPANLDAGAELIMLRLITTDAFVNGASIRFTLASDPLNELANEHYNVINNATISMDILDASTIGINEMSSKKDLTFTNYPNPFKNYTIINYSLPADGNVILEVRDLLGKTVKTLVNEKQTSGDHSLRFDAGNLVTGIYMATIRLNTNTDEYVKTIKLVNDK